MEHRLVAYVGEATVTRPVSTRPSLPATLSQWTPGLGALAVIAGVGWLAFLSPTLGYAVFNVVALIALIGSIAMIGWLLVKGVDEERWRAVAGASAGVSRC